MTVVVGYAPGHAKSGALELAAAIAIALGEDLTVVNVVSARWNVPSMARVDGEFAQWAAQQSEQTLAEARVILGRIAPELAVDCQSLQHRSVASALMKTAEDLSATVVVLGSPVDGHPGRIGLGSTGDHLVHSAEIPVAIAPHGYCNGRTGVAAGFTRITCGVIEQGRGATRSCIAAASALAQRARIPLRLVTFAVRLGTMYPSTVGFDAEDDLAEAAREHADHVFDRWRSNGVIGPQVQTVVGMGHGWAAAVEAVTWEDAELLLLGSRPHGTLAHVFLGSSATKIMRYAPVPVVILPSSSPVPTAQTDP